MSGPGQPSPHLGRRIVRVRISDAMLLSLFRQGMAAVPVKGALPDDAELVGIEWVPGDRDVTLYVASESFDPVPEGQEPPELTVIFRSYPPVGNMLAPVGPAEVN